MGRDIFSRQKPHGADLVVNHDRLALLVHRGAVYRSTGVCVLCMRANENETKKLLRLSHVQQISSNSKNMMCVDKDK